MHSGSKLHKFLNQEKSAGVIFCMPFIIGFIVFLVVPMGISFYYSFAIMIFCHHRNLLVLITILKCLREMKCSGNLSKPPYILPWFLYRFG